METQVFILIINLKDLFQILNNLKFNKQTSINTSKTLKNVKKKKKKYKTAFKSNQLVLIILF